MTPFPREREVTNQAHVINQAPSGEWLRKGGDAVQTWDPAIGIMGGGLANYDRRVNATLGFNVTVLHMCSVVDFLHTGDMRRVSRSADVSFELVGNCMMSM